jgi:vacuolar-type H+-ATPase subunit I/STV1
MIPVARERLQLFAPLASEASDLSRAASEAAAARARRQDERSIAQLKAEERAVAARQVKEHLSLVSELDKKRDFLRREIDARLRRLEDDLRAAQEDTRAATAAGDFSGYKVAAARVADRQSEYWELRSNRETLAREVAELRARADATLDEARSRPEFASMLVAAQMQQKPRQEPQ